MLNLLYKVRVDVIASCCRLSFMCPRSLEFHYESKAINMQAHYVKCLWINTPAYLHCVHACAHACVRRDHLAGHLTRAYGVLGARADPLYHWIMSLTDRDRLIVLGVGRFGQLSTGHVRSLFFEGISSQTPTKRALLRLTRRRYLARIERPLAGGNKGGSGQYIYQLGPEGWKLCRRETKYWPFRAVNQHTLAIADVFIALKRLEAEGRYKVVGFATEPDTWETIAGAEVRPDLHVELADTKMRRTFNWWIEVDMGTERQKQLKDKMARYYHAWQHSEEETTCIFPLVAFLVPDDDRLAEVRWLIARGDEDAQALFTVILTATFPQSLLL